MALLPENAMLGPYRIAALVGEGGMGAVYRARDTRLGRDVAIKVLTNVALNDRDRVARFAQEARTTGMLNHPNLLTVYDVGQAGDTPYLVSELLEGENLRERLSRGPIPPRKAVEIALGIAQGLVAAHEKGVVHRDLKPDNIYLTREGRVKILDFGIAKLSLSSAESSNVFSSESTEPGKVMGTVGYMSPEQVRGDPVDQRSDIFSFGAILYEMLAGKLAFKRESAVETMNAILKEDAADLTDSVPNIAPPLERLVRRCLEKDREHRFQSARDLAFNMEMFSTISGGVTVPRRPEAGPSRAGTSAPVFPSPEVAAPSSIPSVPPPVPKQTTPLRAVTAARTRPVPVARTGPRASPALLAILYLAAICGVGYAGWYFANRRHEARGETSFRRVTFRRGEVRSARFTRDGETIVYSASWDGRPSDIFAASRPSPEARPLGIPDADVLSVSRSAELAILLRRDRLSGLGTLARVPLAGGVPRELATNVLQADWSPDGSTLAVIRAVGNGYRLEYPIGKIKYSTPHYIREIRVSPDGSRVAFIEPHGGANDIVVVSESRPESIARGWSHGATGLSWSPDGNEIWITATNTSAPPSLWAVSLKGERRLVSRLTGSMRLFDISPAGNVLISNGMWRAALLYSAPGSGREREISWLDWSIAGDLSADGRTLLFSEAREGGGERGSVFLRRADAQAPVRIGEGYGDALSPDGKWVMSHSGAKLVLLPTGAGEPRELQVDGSFELGAAWLPDSKRVIVGGALPKGNYRLLLIEIETLDEKVKPLSPENIAVVAVRPFALSPDGRLVAGMTAESTIALYPTDGSLAAARVRGVEKGEVPIQWSSDGRSLYVYRPTALPARVYRVSLSDGTRRLWREFTPSDPAGVYRISPVVMTTNANAYAYNALRSMSDLYVAEGLR